MAIKFTHRPGLVAYITCGDPSLQVSRDVALAAIDAGADVIELGVPFSDPVADGPVIQRASERALAQGTDLAGVIDIARQVTGHPIPVRKVSRRAGDPAVLIASSEKAQRLLGWRPQNSNVESIVRSAWEWHRSHPHGYCSA